MYNNIGPNRKDDEMTDETTAGVSPDTEGDSMPDEMEELSNLVSLLVLEISKDVSDYRKNNYVFLKNTLDSAHDVILNLADDHDNDEFDYEFVFAISKILTTLKDPRNIHGFGAKSSEFPMNDSIAEKVKKAFVGLFNISVDVNLDETGWFTVVHSDFYSTLPSL